VLKEITPLILTHNEAPNIGRVLERLIWADRTVVIDSGSTDQTLQIVSRYPQAQVIERPFVSFADQCNFGLLQIGTEWTLSIDADYVLSEQLVRSLANLSPTEGVDGYLASFVYCVNGRPLRGTLYPPRIVLHRVMGARYVNEGHGHRVSVPGEVRRLDGVIYHDDRKQLARWLDAQIKYARLEADYLLGPDSTRFSRVDRLRRIGVPMPLLVIPYVLFVKGCIWSGWAGWSYALQRMFAEVLIALELMERRVASRSNRQQPSERS